MLPQAQYPAFVFAAGARPIFIDLGGRKKGLPRGKPFKKGERLPFQFKPGQSRNPGGRPKSLQTMKSITLITRSVLCRLASGDSAHPAPASS